MTFFNIHCIHSRSIFSEVVPDWMDDFIILFVFNNHHRWIIRSDRKWLARFMYHNAKNTLLHTHLYPRRVLKICFLRLTTITCADDESRWWWKTWLKLKLLKLKRTIFAFYVPFHFKIISHGALIYSRSFHRPKFRRWIAYFAYLLVPLMVMMGSMGFIGMTSGF